jgi:hypothetical protein
MANPGQRPERSVPREDELKILLGRLAECHSFRQRSMDRKRCVDELLCALGAVYPGHWVESSVRIWLTNNRARVQPLIPADGPHLVLFPQPIEQQVSPEAAHVESQATEADPREAAREEARASTNVSGRSFSAENALSRPNPVSVSDIAWPVLSAGAAMSIGNRFIST